MPRAETGRWLLPLGMISGSLFATVFESVPAGWLLVAAATSALPLLAVRRLRWLVAALLACCWSL